MKFFEWVHRKIHNGSDHSKPKPPPNTGELVQNIVGVATTIDLHCILAIGTLGCPHEYMEMFDNSDIEVDRKAGGKPNREDGAEDVIIAKVEGEEEEELMDPFLDKAAKEKERTTLAELFAESDEVERAYVVGRTSSGFGGGILKPMGSSQRRKVEEAGKLSVRPQGGGEDEMLLKRVGVKKNASQYKRLSRIISKMARKKIYPSAAAGEREASTCREVNGKAKDDGSEEEDDGIALSPSLPWFLICHGPPKVAA